MVDAPLHEYDLVDDQGLFVLAERLSEHEHLDGALQIVERREHHRVAVARADPLGLRDDPADRDQVLVAAIRERRYRAIHPRAQGLAQRLERVRGDEQADRLLLDRQQLRLVELLARDRGIHGSRQRARPILRRAGRALPLARRRREVEDRRLADERVLLCLLPRRLRLLEHFEHAPAAGPGRSEGSALDQRLDRLAVHRPAVDALAEVPQRAELAPFAARLLDRLHSLIPDSLDGVQAEADDRPRGSRRLRVAPVCPAGCPDRELVV